MKADIHPKYYTGAEVSCACGNTFTTGSTKPQIHVDICAACHPFFTGEMRLVDTQGRIERFQAKQKRAAVISQRRKKKAKSRRRQERPSSLKEMLKKETKLAKKSSPKKEDSKS